jgi:TRAP-type C4-dicarboxylate transport system permease small subunit
MGWFWVCAICYFWGFAVYGAALYWDDCFVELRRMFRLLFLPENWRYLALYIG